MRRIAVWCVAAGLAAVLVGIILRATLTQEPECVASGSEPLGMTICTFGPDRGPPPHPVGDWVLSIGILVSIVGLGLLLTPTACFSLCAACLLFAAWRDHSRRDYRYWYFEDLLEPSPTVLLIIGGLFVLSGVVRLLFRSRRRSRRAILATTLRDP